MRIVAYLAVALTLGAQAKREPPPGPLRAIHVKGNSLYPADAIASVSGLKIGQRVSPAQIETARQKLQDLEVFTSVAFDYRTTPGPAPAYDVTFEVVENQQLFPMRFERLGDPEAIRSYLKEHVDLYADRIPDAEGALKRYKDAVEAFSKAKIRASISPAR